MPGEGLLVEKRICSAVKELQPDPDFKLSQQSELQFPEESGQQHFQHSEAGLRCYSRGR